jgi:hypothetical protein
MSHCEDTETETDCFVGCGFGDKNGGTYRFLLPEIDNRFTKPRCKLSIHPRCACGNSRAASPPMTLPPPPPRTYTEEWNVVQSPFADQNGVAYDTSRGVVNAMAQRLVNGRTLDLSLRAGPMHLYEVRYTHATRPPPFSKRHSDANPLRIVHSARARTTARRRARSRARASTCRGCGPSR